MSHSVLKSAIDSSVNFILAGNEPGEFLECRYVQRPDLRYVSVYLSSAYGCNKGCQMCHLTATGQKSIRQATLQDFIKQAELVLDYACKQGTKSDIIYWNFMARGEPLDNPVILKDWAFLSWKLNLWAKVRGFKSRFNISTIMPKHLHAGSEYTSTRESSEVLVEIFKDGILPTLYYSWYGLGNEFRQKWLPGAMGYNQAIVKLQTWQWHTQKLVKFHFALIKGQNDDTLTHSMMANIAENLHAQVNLVRFNPPPGSEFEEATNYEQIRQLWTTRGYPCKIKERVGPDVFASCGTFVT